MSTRCSGLRLPHDTLPYPPPDRQQHVEHAINVLALESTKNKTKQNKKQETKKKLTRSAAALSSPVSLPASERPRCWS